MRKTRPKNQQGVLITNNVILETHEQRTVNFLLSLGYNIELICPSYTLNSKNADFIMNGQKWEMKCPKGKGKYLIRDTLRVALRQSSNIILDLRRIKIPQTKAIKSARKYSSEMKDIRRLLVISQNQLFDFTKKV